MSALPKESPRNPSLRLTDDRPDDPLRAAALVERIQSGDESAWPDLIAIYTPRVFAMCRSRLSSAELAEEITQSVFVTLATKLADNAMYIEEGKFEPWLFRITMNRVRDEARRAKRHAKPTDPAAMPEATAADGSPAASNATPQEALNLLRRAVAELPDHDRSIIELRHFSAMSFQAISDLLEVPLGTALARHHRALKKLRSTLGNTDLAQAFDL